MVKNLLAKAGEAASIPGIGRSPGGEHGNPIQCSCPENPADRGVHGVAKSRQGLGTKQQHVLG